MKILLAGGIVAEKQYLLDKVPAVKEVGIASEVNYLTSSKIINSGRILATNNEVDMFGVVGEDNEGKKAKGDLKNYGINPKYVYQTSKAPTGQVLVLTNSKGQSAFILHLSAGDLFDNTKLKSLSEYSWVYMATSMKLPQLYKMIDRANIENVNVFLDFPNQQRDFDKSKLKTVKFVVPNRQEAELLLGIEIISIKDALSAVVTLKTHTNGNALITLDKDGCVAFGEGWSEPKHFPTASIKSVDDTGSGDIMRGVLLREFIKFGDLEKSIKTALSLATKSLRYKGVNNSIEKIK